MTIYSVLQPYYGIFIELKFSTWLRL